MRKIRRPMLQDQAPVEGTRAGMELCGQDIEVLLLPLDLIDPDPLQPRLRVDDRSVRDLTASIRQYGVLEPILVRRAGTRYQVICGHRRVRASELAGRTHIPAIICRVDDATARAMQLVENAQRRGLSEIEWARGLKVLYERCKAADSRMSWKKIGKLVGLSSRRLHQLLDLLELPCAIQRMLEERLLSSSHALQLVRLKALPEAQERLAREACRSGPESRSYGLSVAAVRERIDRMLAHRVNVDWRKSLDQLRAAVGDGLLPEEIDEMITACRSIGSRLEGLQQKGCDRNGAIDFTTPAPEKRRRVRTAASGS